MGREQAATAQLFGGRRLPAPIVNGAESCGLFLLIREYAGTMGTHAMINKRKRRTPQSDGGCRF